jgi:hypothetical protein
LIACVTTRSDRPCRRRGIAAGGWLFHFAMPKGTTGSVASEAAQFAKFLTNDENQLEFAKLAGAFPTAKKAVADPHFQKLRTDAGAYEKAMAIGAKRMDVVRTLYVCGWTELRTAQQAAAGRRRGRDHWPQGCENRARRGGRILERQSSVHEYPRGRCRCRSGPDWSASGAFGYRASRAFSRRALCPALLAPALLLLALFTFWPVLGKLYLAFTEYNHLTRQVGRPRELRGPAR